VPAQDIDTRIGDMEGPQALPRSNGELVFEAPWEGRVFGLAVALNDRRVYNWDDFRARLIDEIAAADACGAESSYYERWLTAFEKLLVDRGLVTSAELEARTAEYASGERTDEDHDHDEDDHDHDHR
jgi:nitrile hydratase accessory protein